MVSIYTAILLASDKMSRCRGLTSLDECVNPRYHTAWGSVVTVKEAIFNSFHKIEQEAYRRVTHYGHLSLILPDLNASAEILKYIYSLCTRLTAANPSIRVMVGNTKWNKQDMLVNFVPFSLHKGSFDIPVSWDDNEPDYTWQHVLDNEQHYSSSSTDRWPPLKYKIQATKEKIVNIRKLIEESNGLLT